ncbi:MAG: hypothetical protein COU98_01075 [Candidatus Staskawiczbacteria bacterium CG10_big_fil_rev_8_21_14_0_10_38_10]|uniref:Glycosyltransferase 2-like domain-containing protein n=1 Tax=Candidatus Staskawiczbacteria bacterium CG10_big_fil_rev_8_21_14_0_10_38_10 TaxID=1974891 RepID=A0A2H9T1J7_9BACT|nr:MAG: hypothetical protein COU98_01075 [Candidatus Staskawiczbacteria bacterium CG10_big_fil_rev_8_21_14_0_10_38_10]
MLSIIIPTLNEEKYLFALLETIKKQNFKDYEIIVADAGSKDKTIEIAKNYGCKITSGGLPAKGRNEGAKIAKGDLLLFLDADIILPQNFLENLLNEFKKRNLDIASSPILANERRMDKLVYRFYNLWSRLTQRFLPHAADVILVKKKIYQIIGGFEEEIKLAEDHFFARKAKKTAKARYGFLNIAPVFTSSRRFEKDGRIRTCAKYILAEAYMVFFGSIKSNTFEYKFDHYTKNKKDI